MLNERKLTGRELDKRAEAIQGLLSNKRTLVKKYGKDAEKVMYGIATKQAKSKVEGMNKEKIKELIQQALQKEGNDNVDANFSGIADYSEEDKALGQEDELEMKGLEEDKDIKEINNPDLNEVFQSIRNLASTAGMDELEAAEIAINEIKIEFGVDAFHESLDESADKWNKLSDDQKLDLLLQAFEDPDKAEKYVEFKWNDLPDVATQNMRLGEDLDVGHQDDEPGMLKAELARAGKMIQMLYKAIDKYDGQGEVDFPQWWQAKIIKANAMLDSAFDYLDGEENVAKIDAMIDVVDINEGVDKKYSDFLLALRDSGVTNMFGAAPYLQKEFGLDKREAREILSNWMQSFNEGIDYDEALTLRGMLADLKKEREQLFRDMEQEAEPEGGPIADRYGNELNKIEDRMYKIAKQLRDYDMNEATRQDLGMVSSISKSRAKSHLKNPSNDGSKVYGLDSDGKRIELKDLNDVDKFKKFEIDADLKEKVNEAMDGGRLFDYFANKGYVVKERRPDGYPKKEGVVGYQVTDRPDSGRRSDNPQTVIFQHNPSTDQFTISQMNGYMIDQKDAIKAGMRQQGSSWVAGIDSYITDGNYTPVNISAEGLKDIVDHVMGGLEREAKAQRDFYADRGPTSGTIDELKAKIASAVKEVVDSRKKKEFKVGDKVTYLGHPGEITKVNKEITGVTTYNVSYDKGTGKTKVSNIYNKGGEIKALEEKLTKSSSVEDHIEDFKDSDAPQFKGKSLDKIKQMALASFLSKQKK